MLMCQFHMNDISLSSTRSIVKPTLFLICLNTYDIAIPVFCTIRAVFVPEGGSVDPAVDALAQSTSSRLPSSL